MTLNASKTIEHDGKIDVVASTQEALDWLGRATSHLPVDFKFEGMRVRWHQTGPMTEPDRRLMDKVVDACQARITLDDTYRELTRHA